MTWRAIPARPSVTEKGRRFLRATVTGDPTAGAYTRPLLSST
jgi:hypothetical protein